MRAASPPAHIPRQYLGEALLGGGEVVVRVRPVVGDDRRVLDRVGGQEHVRVVGLKAQVPSVRQLHRPDLEGAPRLEVEKRRVVDAVVVGELRRCVCGAVVVVVMVGGGGGGSGWWCGGWWSTSTDGGLKGSNNYFTRAVLFYNLTRTLNAEDAFEPVSESDRQEHSGRSCSRLSELAPHSPRRSAVTFIPRPVTMSDTSGEGRKEAEGPRCGFVSSAGAQARG